ncbi:MAG: hypothetical protein WDN06_12755 [Asticcacaulis sp.]
MVKSFCKTEVISVFKRGEQVIQRSFAFKLSNDKPFENYNELLLAKDTPSGTKINLRTFRDIFDAKAFRDPADIQNSILAHFISLFAQPKRLKINLIDEDEAINLSDLFFDSIVGEKTPVDVIIDDQHTAKNASYLAAKEISSYW